jgi:hypothetical protein
MKKFFAVIVLSDGETWETVEGQSICIIDEDQYAKLCNDEISARDLQPVVELGLKDYTPFNDVA